MNRDVKTPSLPTAADRDPREEQREYVNSRIDAWIDRVRQRALIATNRYNLRCAAAHVVLLEQARAFFLADIERN